MVPDAAALVAFGDEQGWPIVAKTSRGGYDGKGVWRLDSAAQASEPFAQLSDGVQIIGEEFVDFARELSALVVRSPSGQAAAYPISESVQRNGICVETITPAPELDDDHAVAAQQLALRIAHELGVVGVLAVELMQRRRRVRRCQRARDATAQHRPLDDRRSPHVAVRESPAGRARSAARRTGQHPTAGR